MMMAIIRFKGLDKLEKKFKERVYSVINDKGVLKEVAEHVKKNIKGEVRRAKNPETLEGQPTLKAKSKKSRAHLAKHNKTHSLYRNSRANLTITGQLIDSIVYKLGKSRPFIKFKSYGMHKPYLNSKGKPSGRPVPNKDIIRYQQEAGRTILGISEKSKKTILNIINKALLRNLR
jgi:hypothetical protein